MSHSFSGDADDSHVGHHKWNTHGWFEVFYVNAQHVQHSVPPTEPGYYWWPCSPGCLPDGDPCGPHRTSAEAHREAMEGEEYSDSR